MKQPSLPEIKITLFHNLEDASDGVFDIKVLQEYCAATAAYWGIPGKIQIEVQTHHSASYPLQLVVNDKLLIGSRRLMDELRSVFEGLPLRTYDDHEEWLRLLLQGGQPTGTRFLIYILEAWLQEQAIALFAYPQFEYFWHSLAIPSEAEQQLSGIQWYDLFRTLLELGISLAPKERIKQLIIDEVGKSHVKGDSYHRILERLFSDLKSTAIKLRISQKDFEVLATELYDENPFLLIRDIVFNETGVVIPSIELDFSDDLSPEVFQLQVHSRLFPERIILRAASSLEMSQGREPLNPYTFKPVTNTHTLPKGLSSPLNYIALAVAGIVRGKAFLWIDQEMVNQQAEKLKANYPSVMKALATSFLNVSLLTSSLRLLQNEGLSIKGMLPILEHMLAASVIDIDPKSSVVFEDSYADPLVEMENWRQRPKNLAKYVRKQMRREVQRQQLGSKKIFLVYKLGKDWVLQFEALRSERENVSIYDQRKLLGNVKKALEKAGRPAAFVTYSTVSDMLADIVGFTYPNIPVLNIEELTGLKVHEILTIN